MPAEKILVTLSLELEVEDAEEKAYYVNPLSTAVAASCIADVWDNADQMTGKLLSVNGVKKEDIQRLLNAELGI